MKSIIIIISILTLSNASFLRELSDTTFQKADLSLDCITTSTGFKVTLTAASGTSVPTGMTATFTKGEDSFSSTACAQDGQKDLVMDCGSFTIASTLPKGNYTLSLVHASDKVTITATPAPLCYTTECPPALELLRPRLLLLPMREILLVTLQFLSERLSQQNQQ